MEFIMSVVKTIRSLRSDYNLNKTKADCKDSQELIQCIHLVEIEWEKWRGLGLKVLLR